MSVGGGDALAAAVPDVLRRYRYKPRSVAPLGVRPAGRWLMKGTIVTVRGTAAHFPDIVAASWEQAASGLAQEPDDGRDAGVAHLLVHLGLGGVRLLLDWWVDGDALMRRPSYASFDDPTRFTDVALSRRGPCVWELAILAHERDAWLRHVLANPAGPDLAGYLADGLSGAV